MPFLEIAVELCQGKESDLELHLHDVHLRKSLPSKLIRAGQQPIDVLHRGMGLDVAGFMTDACFKFLDVIDTQLEPSTVVLGLIETSLGCLTHAASKPDSDKVILSDGLLTLGFSLQVHSTLLRVTKRLELMLEKRMDSLKHETRDQDVQSNQLDVQQVDIGVLQLGSTLFRYLSIGS